MTQRASVFVTKGIFLFIHIFYVSRSVGPDKKYIRLSALKSVTEMIRRI